MDNVYEYGNDKTWHDSTAVDVETDRHGNVVAVWFRCQMIPFEQHIVDESRARDMIHATKGLSLKLQAVKLKVVDSRSSS